jgi:hypothetical protein
MASLSAVKTVSNITIVALVIVAGFALLKLLPGVFGTLGESIAKAIKDAVAGGASDAGETAAKTAGAGVEGLTKGALDAGQSWVDKLFKNFVPFGSKDQRIPADLDPTHWASYYDKASSQSYSDQATSDTPDFGQLLFINYAVDDKGNIVDRHGNLISYAQGNI